MRESFGEVVESWNTGPGRAFRLEKLCELLELEHSHVGQLRYQLFHRAASAVFEAERYGAGRSALLVHSFDPRDSSFTDYAAFVEALGLGKAVVNGMTHPKTIGDVELRLGWVRDTPQASRR